MTLVLPVSGKDYIQLPDTETHYTKSRIAFNNDWLQQHILVQENGAEILILNDSLFLDRMCLGMEGKLYDGAGNAIPEDELQRIFNERNEIGIPYRGENIDALFEFHKHKFSKIDYYPLYLSQSHAYSENEGLNPDYSEPLDTDTLMKDRGIDLIHFIKEAHTSQGLPRKDVKKGDYFYFFPKNRTVAMLGADSDWSYLSCNWDPANSYDGLGVCAKISTGNLKQFLEGLRDKYKVPNKQSKQ